MAAFAEPAANHGSWEYELASGRVSWSASLYRIHGVSPADFTPAQETISEQIHPDDRAAVAELIGGAIEDGTPFACQYRIARPDGDTRTVLVRGARVEDATGVSRLIGITQDVTGREGEEEHLWHLANHDSLSGLYNRRRFMEELERELTAAKRTGTPGAVVMLDLDNFKDINDSLGHMAGDNLLIGVAAQLRRRLRATDTLARLGGDEFACVLPDCTAANAERIAGQLLEALRSDTTVRIGGIERSVTGSLGVATFDAPFERTAEELLVEADLAMYRAKDAGRARVEAFDEALRAEMAERVGLEGELQEALRRGELLVHYQPLVALVDGRTVGCEALVRWEHSERGLVSPAEFIPVAEETGLISAIGEYVLREACVQAAEWRRHGHQVYVSVNVSPVQLMRDDVAGLVAEVLRESQLPAPLLCLEITETSLLADSGPMMAGLRELKRLGVRISIDDFGGGASSLGLLRLLPIDQIKIDRMFVEGIAEHADDRAIVAAVVSLAAELGLTVVAEGVETERQQAELRKLAAEYAQGFLYARAVPPDQLELGERLVASGEGLA